MAGKWSVLWCMPEWTLLAEKNYVKSKILHVWSREKCLNLSKVVIERGKSSTKSKFPSQRVLIHDVKIETKVIFLDPIHMNFFICQQSVHPYMLWTGRSLMLWCWRIMDRPHFRLYFHVTYRYPWLGNVDLVLLFPLSITNLLRFIHFSPWSFVSYLCGGIHCSY